MCCYTCEQWFMTSDMVAEDGKWFCEGCWNDMHPLPPLSECDWGLE